jgi:hypothetical protein
MCDVLIIIIIVIIIIIIIIMALQLSFIVWSKHCISFLEHGTVKTSIQSTINLCLA